MKHVCPDCGYESTNPGTCPECEVDLLKREDEVDSDVDEDSNEDTEEDW